MMSEIQPVTFERHAKKQLLPLSSWAFAANLNLAPLLPAEFSQAAQCFPIVFVEKEEEVSSFALLGLQPDKNLLLDVKNQWLVNYIPAVLRRYPFILARKDEASEEYVLCIDEASGLLADAGGAALFDDEGNRTEALEKAFNFVGEYQKQIPGGRLFCALLQELDLLVPYNINLQKEEQTVKLEGLLQIDEKKMGELSDDDFLKLRSKGVLPLIYAHLFSLAKINLLANKYSEALLPKKADAAKLPNSFTF
jgi:hypothetical protein